MIADNVASRTKTNGETARPWNLVSEMSRVERRHAVNNRMLANEGNNNRRRQHVIMQAFRPFAWAEQLTVSVFVNVLNDDEHEVEDDHSATHHDDRGGRGQIGGPCLLHVPTKGFGLCRIVSPQQVAVKNVGRNAGMAPPIKPARALNCSFEWPS